MDLKAVGQRIKAAREAKNLTQEELAALVNLSTTHVSVIERGLKVTKLGTFVAIANALDISADALLIDVVNGVTLASASSMDKDFEGVGGNTEAARKVGTKIAERALAKNITEVVFDRGGYLYHGRVKELAEGAREGGLKF